MQAQLTVARGSSAGKAFPIDGTQFIIGRATGCHLRPQSDAISRQHCAFMVKQDRLYVKDLGSRNGTYLNEEKLTGATEVKTGDLVRIGPLLLRVELSPPEDLTTISTDTVDVLEATAEAGEGIGDESVIGGWLDELDEEVTSQERPTREFDLDATITTTVIRTDDKEQKDSDKVKKKKKKEFGKLPTKTSPDDTRDNSVDAAADTLRELYNRGM